MWKWKRLYDEGDKPSLTFDKSLQSKNRYISNAKIQVNLDEVFCKAGRIKFYS